MSIPVEYRLMSLEFRNGRPENERRLGFRSVMLLHDDRQKAVVIEGGGKLDAREKQLLGALCNFEISTIRYEIQAKGYPPVPFCHPFPKGTNVMLRPLVGTTQLFLHREGNKRFFSDNFTLRDVSEGKIDSGQKAYQFLE
jgi:hypothetical protein